MRSTFATWTCSALLASGCVHPQVTTHPNELKPIAAQLRAGQPGEVLADGTRYVQVTGNQSVELIEQNGTRHRMSINEVVDHCASQDCGNDRVLLGTRTKLSPEVKGYAYTLGILGGVAGLGVCTAYCDSPFNYISGGTLVVLGVGSAVLLYLLIDAIAHYGRH